MRFAPYDYHAVMAFVKACEENDLEHRGLKYWASRHGWSGIVAIFEQFNQMADWSPTSGARTADSGFFRNLPAREKQVLNTVRKDTGVPRTSSVRSGGLVRWPGQMTWPDGLVRWPGQMAWPPGLVVWPGRLAWSSGLVV